MNEFFQAVKKKKALADPRKRGEFAPSLDGPSAYDFSIGAFLASKISFNQLLYSMISFI